MNAIQNNQILSTLGRMHYESSREMGKIMKGMSKAIFRELRPEDMEDTYIAISEQAGRYIYDLIVTKKAKNIVEFGTSFGISTLYLGAAAKQTGGQVITSEILRSKCEVAQANFESAGLVDVIDLREGDAMETLKNVPEGIDFLLLDGWNDLYLPLLHLLEPKFKKGTIIYTDNASFRSTKPLLNYFKSNRKKYRSKRIQDGNGGAELTEVLY